ncbi:MAG TPA: ribosome small subunit-dependent GTPase A, partial [Planctomycetota bacterium]|nr:ribosome small subunit-dependent GTPase A [Planctomycetota bacterium]
VELAPGTYVTDTPGLEIFALWEITPETLASCFVEFAGLAGKCKFRNCSHLKELKCAVKDAVASGAIAASRYAHYAAIWKNLVEARRLFQ